MWSVCTWGGLSGILSRAIRFRMKRTLRFSDKKVLQRHPLKISLPFCSQRERQLEADEEQNRSIFRLLQKYPVCLKVSGGRLKVFALLSHPISLSNFSSSHAAIDCA